MKRFPVEDATKPECHMRDNGQSHGPMVLRRNRETGTEFWGCAKWPKCSITIDAKEWDRQEASRLGYDNDDEEVRWDR